MAAVSTTAATTTEHCTQAHLITKNTCSLPAGANGNRCYVQVTGDKFGKVNTTTATHALRENTYALNSVIGDCSIVSYVYCTSSAGHTPLATDSNPCVTGQRCSTTGTTTPAHALSKDSHRLKAEARRRTY